MDCGSNVVDPAEVVYGVDRRDGGTGMVNIHQWSAARWYSQGQLHKYSTDRDEKLGGEYRVIVDAS